MSFISKDDSTPSDYVKRLREAASQWAKEHPGQLASQGGDLAGIDRDTGEDIIKTNEERARKKKLDEIGKEFAKEWWNHPEKSQREIVEQYLEQKQENKKEEKEALESLNTTLREIDKGPLPDDYKGIDYKGMFWKEAVLHCLNRTDLDFELPGGLPPDIIEKCYEIQITKVNDDEGMMSMIVLDKNLNKIYASVFPTYSFTVDVKGNKLQQ